MGLGPRQRHRSCPFSRIKESLEAYGIGAERKSLYSDIESLRQYGMDIIGRQMDRAYYYSVGNRQFELAELKLLVDSVQAAKFITAKKSNDNQPPNTDTIAYTSKVLLKGP